MTPQAYCAERVRRSGSSFAASFRFLPKQKRQAIEALYAFCREVDDVVDDCSDPALAATTLAWWQTEIERMQQGQAQHPVTLALAAAHQALPHMAWPQEQFEEIIAGMAMDIQHEGFADYPALLLYCHRVAGVVGLLTAEIFGYRHHATSKYAHELGIAFQLINIIRDVGEDARRNRIYLPQDELAHFQLDPADILACRPQPAFFELMRMQVVRARATLARALALLPQEDRRSQRPGLIMAAIYGVLLDEIEQDGLRVLTHRVQLPPLRKAWIAFRTWSVG